MPEIKRKKGWNLPEREATPEAVYLNRRQFIKAMGLSGLGAWGILSGCLNAASEAAQQDLEQVRKTIPEPHPPYPASRNPEFTVDRATTTEEIAAAYNNFYEFTTDKDRVWRLAEKLDIDPWKVEIGGLVNKPQTLDVDDLHKMFELEERVYRFRCVEAWAMVVPWVGFPLRELIERVEPTSDAKYIRFISFLRPEQAIGQKTQSWYPWPYYEALTLAEAMNELTLVVTGIYGHALPKQHGAPIRIITPWKYGYKSPKSIVKIEFVREQPATFWNDLAPNEYGFFSNVNPEVPHPRWSQATERIIGTDKRVPTLLYNGYEEYVGDLY